MTADPNHGATVASQSLLASLSAGEWRRIRRLGSPSDDAAKAVGIIAETVGTMLELEPSSRHINLFQNCSLTSLGRVVMR